MKTNPNRKNALQTEVNNLIASIWEVRDVIMARKYVDFVKKEIVDNAGLVISAHRKQTHSSTLNILR
jgi:hypothetical protein